MRTLCGLSNNFLLRLPGRLVQESGVPKRVGSTCHRSSKTLANVERGGKHRLSTAYFGILLVLMFSLRKKPRVGGKLVIRSKLTYSCEAPSPENEIFL